MKLNSGHSDNLGAWRLANWSSDEAYDSCKMFNSIDFRDTSRPKVVSLFIYSTRQLSSPLIAEFARALEGFDYMVDPRGKGVVLSLEVL